MEDDTQFCLRWNNHQSTLIQNFDTLLESGTLVDCTLAAEGKYLKAHKVVLSACSPYFEDLLSEHYDKHPVFILKDVKFKELKAMMEYMYRGEVNISQEQLTALLKAAESLQIKGLSDNRTGGSTSSTTSGPTTGKADARLAKTSSTAASSTAASASSSVDIPHASSGLTIEKNKVPRQSLQQISVSDLPEGSASPQLRGLSSREGSQSPTRKRRRTRRRSLGNEDTVASIENHEASNSSDFNINAPALGVAPVAEEKSHAESADPIGRSALMQQLTKPADEMLQIPIEKPEPSEEMIQPKSEYLDDQESVEDLTNLDDDMNDQNELEQDNSRAGPSHDPSQHTGIPPQWHNLAGDRSNSSVVGAATGPTGGNDEVFLAQEAQAQRDSQGGKTDRRLNMVSLLRRNRKKNNQRPLTRSVLSDQHQQQNLEHEDRTEQSRQQLELYNDSSLDSLMFAASLGLISTNQSTSVKDLMLVVRDQLEPKEQLNSININNSSMSGSAKDLMLVVQDQNSQASRKHGRQNQQPHQQMEFHCRFCGKGYRWKSTMKRHETLECGDKPPSFQCPHCDYRARQRGNLTVHLKRHHLKA